MPIDDSYIPNKRDFYTPDLLPYEIYVATGKSIINLNNPYDTPHYFIFSYDASNTDHTTTRKNLAMPWIKEDTYISTMKE